MNGSNYDASQADDSNSSESVRRMRTGANFIESAQLYENFFKDRGTQSLPFKIFTSNYLERYFHCNPFTPVITHKLHYAMPRKLNGITGISDLTVA